LQNGKGVMGLEETLCSLKDFATVEYAKYTSVRKTFTRLVFDDFSLQNGKEIIDFVAGL